MMKAEIFLKALLDEAHSIGNQFEQQNIKYYIQNNPYAINERVDFKKPKNVKINADPNSIIIEFQIEDKYYGSLIDILKSKPSLAEELDSYLKSVADETYENKIKYLLKNYRFRSAISTARDGLKFILKNILRKAYYNISKDKDKLNKIGIDDKNGCKFGIKISPKRYTADLNIKISLNRIIELDSKIFGPTIVFDEHTNKAIVKTLKTYFPIELDENTNVSSTYFTIVDFNKDRYLGLIKDFNTNTKAITFWTRTIYKNNSFKLYNNLKQLKLPIKKMKDGYIISIEVNKEFNFIKIIDLL